MKKQQIDVRIAAVRDLIFGEYIEQYDPELAGIYDELKVLEDKINKNLFA